MIKTDAAAVGITKTAVYQEEISLTEGRLLGAYCTRMTVSASFAIVIINTIAGGGAAAHDRNTRDRLLGVRKSEASYRCAVVVAQA